MSAAEKLEEKIDALTAEVRALRAELARGARRSHTRTAAAKLLGWRRADLDAMVKAGAVRTVPSPTGKPRIPVEEIERLGREGMPQQRKRGRPRKAKAESAENQPVRLSDWKPGS